MRSLFSSAATGRPRPAPGPEDGSTRLRLRAGGPRAILPLACLLLAGRLACPAQAQQPAILTVVVTGADGTPVAGAAVRVLGSAGAGAARGERSGASRAAELAGRSTDTRGEARFESLPAGPVQVQVSAEGFLPMQEGPVELEAGGETVVRFALQQKPVISETVVVTGSGTAAAAQEAPVRTELITSAEVERGVRITLAEAFQAALSGVRVEMNCQNCGFMQIRINGLEGHYTQILEDGLPSYSGVTAVYGVEQVPAGFLEQIEVVKGGSSALYGPGAVAGVINLIRREPRRNRFRLDATAGWQHGRPEQSAGAALQLAPSRHGLAADFYYRGLRRTQADRDGDGFSDLGRRILNAGGFSLFRQFLQGSGRLALHGMAADEFRRGGDQFDRPPHETWITEQAASRRHAWTAGWTHTLAPATYYSLRTSAAFYRRHTYYGAGMDPRAYGETSNPLVVTDAQLAHQAGRHTILAGHQLNWERVEDRAPAYGRALGGVFRNHGIYLQDEWRAAAKLTLLAGARLDRSNQLSRWILSPRAGLKYGINDQLVWRATLSTGFRAPAIFDEDLHIAQVGGEGFLVQNSPGLREERSLSFSTGLQQAGRWRGRRTESGLDVFYTRLRHAFVLAEDRSAAAGARRLLRTNGPGAEVCGLNLDWRAQLSARLGVRGGFTLQRGRWSEPEPQFGSRRFFRAPNSYGFAGFDLSLPSGLELSATADYTGSMLVPHYAGFIAADRLERSPRFVVFNAVLGRSWRLRNDGQLRLFLDVQNLGDSFQRDLDRGPSRDSSYVYGPFEMRRIVLGTAWQF